MIRKKINNFSVVNQLDSKSPVVVSLAMELSTYLYIYLAQSIQNFA